jgi:putative flavoprotein involved in K+ transport
VFDTGRYRAAVAAGHPDRRPMFTALDGATVVWYPLISAHADVKRVVGAVVDA